MSALRSLGVLIPTRNSAALLPAHLAGLRSWIDLADDVVVMDSFSTDGTVELLQDGLPHPHLRCLSHPPGLYASWNAGLAQLHTEFAYIATVGDTITREGLQKLLAAGQELEADVVLSKPVFRRPSGEEVSLEWPVDDFIRCLDIIAPRRVQRLEMIAFAAVHVTHALTGSCASDLFRTAALQRAPFPTEFGTAGDGVWALRAAAPLRWAVLPDKFSTFLLHPTTLSQAENRVQPDAPRADAILREAMAGWRRDGLVNDRDLACLGWGQGQTALTDFLDAKAAFDRLRKARWPWILQPAAWQARRKRRRSWTELQSWKEQALAAVASGQRMPPTQNESMPAALRSGPPALG